MFLAALCCIALGTGSVLAQDQGPRGGQRMGHGPMIMGQQQLTDTTITNRMQLTPVQRSEIDRMNSIYDAEVKKIMGEMPDPQTAPQQDKKMNREEMRQKGEQVKALRKDGRQHVRAVLGDELYIQYLEEALDRHGMMMGNGPRRQRMQRNQNSQQRQGGFGNEGFGDDF